MNRFFLVGLAFLMLASSAFATPSVCPSQTMEFYLTMLPGGSCTINGLLFNGFSYASATVAPSQVGVKPETTPGLEGFDFNAFWAASAPNSSEDSTIGFTVSGSSFTDLHLFMLGGSHSGTGTADVTETYCFVPGVPVANCPSGAAFGGQIMVTNPPPNISDIVFMSAQASISVLKDIGVSAGPNGSATISQVTNEFSNSPEPLSFVLLGSGLLGLGLLRKRIKM